MSCVFSCSNNSALTTSVVGTLKSVAQTTMGLFTFGGVAINPAMLTGMIMNMTGGIVYTYSKYKESKEVRTRQLSVFSNILRGQLLIDCIIRCRNH